MRPDSPQGGGHSTPHPLADGRSGDVVPRAEPAGILAEFGGQRLSRGAASAGIAAVIAAAVGLVLVLTVRGGPGHLTVPAPRPDSAALYTRGSVLVHRHTAGTGTFCVPLAPTSRSEPLSHRQYLAGRHKFGC